MKKPNSYYKIKHVLYIITGFILTSTSVVIVTIIRGQVCSPHLAKIKEILDQHENSDIQCKLSW